MSNRYSFFISLLLIGNWAVAAESGEPRVFELVAEFETASNPDARSVAAGKLLNVNDSWTFDLLYRYSKVEPLFAGNNPKRMLVALLGSHYATEVEAQKLESDLCSVPQTDLPSVLSDLTSYYGERYSGMRSHDFPEILQRQLSKLIDRNVRSINDAATPLLGPFDPAANLSAEQLVATAVRLIGPATGPLSPEANDALLAILRRAAVDKESFKVFGPFLTEQLKKFQSIAEVEVGWSVFISNNRYVRPAMACFMAASLAPKTNEECRLAGEDFILSAVLSIGRGLRPPDASSSATDSKAVLYFALLEMVSQANRLMRKDFKRGTDPTHSFDYSQLPDPFCNYIADIRGREGDMVAQKFLNDRVISLYTDLSNAQAVRTEPKTPKEIVEGLEEKMDKWFSALALVIGASSTDGNGYEKIRAEVFKMSTRGSGFRSFALADNKLHSEFLLPGQKNAQSSKDSDSAGDRYRQKEISLRDYIALMRASNRLDDPLLYQGLKSDPQGRKGVSDDVSICKIIAANGSTEDLGTIFHMWLETRTDTREAMAVAAEKLQFRKIVVDLAGRYDRITYVELRRIVAHMVAHMATSAELNFILHQLEHETDSQALELLAEGLLRLCLHGDNQKEALGKIRDILASESFCQRWFYVASVLRACTPGESLNLDVKVSENQRRIQVDMAVDKVKEILLMGKDVDK